MNRLRKRYDCATELALDCLGGKWKTVILSWLKDGPLRYSDLRALERGLSDKVLSERLRELEEAGFVMRLQRRDGARVYALTDLGLTLRPVLTALFDWGSSQADALGIGLPDGSARSEAAKRA